MPTVTTSRPVPPHYPTPAAKYADLIVHITGLAFALFGGGLLLGLAAASGELGEVTVVVIYALGLLATLSFSTAYNFAEAKWRPMLRRLDHAGIFLMIAGSYTPFTTQCLTGMWAWGMTAAIWTIATLGALGKLFLSGLGKRFWVGVYVALGWLGLIALKPMMAMMPWAALVLLVFGGVLYTSGILFYLNKGLKFGRAIWHGHVVAAAGAHWAAVLVGVVLAAAR